MRWHVFFLSSSVVLSLGACRVDPDKGGAPEEEARDSAAQDTGGGEAPEDGDEVTPGDDTGASDDAPSDDGASDDHALVDPWSPESTEEIRDMASLTAPIIWWIAAVDTLSTASDAVAERGAGCPAVTRGLALTTWEGDCVTKGEGAVVGGTLQVWSGPLGESSRLHAEDYSVRWRDGQRIAVDGDAELRTQGGIYQSMNLTYSSTLAGVDDLTARMVVQLSLREDGRGEGSGYLWVSKRAGGPTGDFNFTWVEDPARGCALESGHKLVMRGAVEVVMESGGDTPCDGAVSVTVDGVPWE